MLDLGYEIGFAELALVEVAGGTLVSETTATSVNGAVETFIAQAEARAAYAIAAASDSSLLASAVATTGTTAAGASVFTAETLILINATLAAAGAAVVSFTSESDPVFQIEGTSTFSFVGQSVYSTAFAATGAASTSIDGVGVRLLTMAAQGSATSTMLGTAYGQANFESVGTDGFAVGAQAVVETLYNELSQSVVALNANATRQTAFTAQSVADVAFSIDRVVAGSFAVVGQTTTLLHGSLTAQTILNVAGISNINFANSSYYDELPRAWDYVIREYELRGVVRPEENRTALYN